MRRQEIQKLFKLSKIKYKSAAFLSSRRRRDLRAEVILGLTRRSLLRRDDKNPRKTKV
jgi:hypothetical protein